LARARGLGPPRPASATDDRRFFSGRRFLGRGRSVASVACECSEVACNVASVACKCSECSVCTAYASTSHVATASGAPLGVRSRTRGVAFRFRASNASFRKATYPSPHCACALLLFGRACMCSAHVGGSSDVATTTVRRSRLVRGGGSHLQGDASHVPCVDAPMCVVAELLP
jgi:hypothetical protein